MASRIGRSVILVIVLALALPLAALAAPPTHGGDNWSEDEYSSDEGTGGKWIEVNLDWQWLTAYEGDTPVLGVPVSTGISGHETPEGEFAIEWKLRWETMAGDDYYLEDVPYVMYFADYLALHGTYWHDNFGYPMSHGCVNLETWAARWLYQWAPIGTPVWIHY